MEKRWDQFVMEESANGTFLQTRRFLNYHPKHRFEDCSFMIFNEKKKLIAVCPACEQEENGIKVFFSHKGSTFGGIIIHKQYYTAERLLALIDCIEQWIQSYEYQKIVLKNTSALFAKEASDLLQYCLFQRGYQSYSELSTYIDLATTPENVLDQFDRNKKRNIAKCEEHELQFRQLFLDEEIEGFHKLLSKNLEKYNAKPIHTVADLLDFKNHRLTDECKFYGVFEDKVLLAAGMMFCFQQTNVIHAQNLSADYTFKEYSPITYLYYKVIEMAKKEGYSKLSWGISTENQGRDLNLSLVRNKESYGSTYANNLTFHKLLG